MDKTKKAHRWAVFVILDPFNHRGYSENRDILMKEKIKTIYLILTLVGFFLIVFSMVYYFIYFLPHHKQAELEFYKQQQLAKEEQEQEAREKAEKKKRESRTYLEFCLVEAHDIYHEKWTEYCKELGREEHCSLPVSKSDRCDENLKLLKDECFKKYPQK